MLENFNEDKRKNPMTQFSDFHTGWSIVKIMQKVLKKFLNLIIRRSLKVYIQLFMNLLMSSCIVDDKKIQEVTNIDLPSSIIEDFTNVYADSGLTQTKIISPKMIEYNNPIRQYREFPNGIEVYTLEEDTLVTGFLRADYAIMNTTDSAIWEGRGHVLLVSRNHDSIFSEHMIWDSPNNQIYNDIRTKIKKHSGGEIISELGFTAKLSSKGIEEYQLKANSGKLIVKNEEDQNRSEKK